MLSLDNPIILGIWKNMKEFVSGKDDIPHMMEHIKAMFETTNQLWMVTGW